MDMTFRYILRQQLWPLVLAVLVIAGIVWMSQSLRFVELVLSRGLPTATLFELAGLVVPMFTSVFLPIVLFGTVAFAYNRMTLDSELVIWRAAGFGPLRLAAPALALAGAVMVVCYALNVYYMPAAYRHFKDLQFAIRSNYTQVLLREGAFNDIGNGVTVYVRERAASGELAGIFIYDRRENGEPVAMMAERGTLVQADNNPRVILLNGNRQVVKRARKDLSILYFDRYTLDLTPRGEDAGPRWREPRERFLHELFRPAATGPLSDSDGRLRLKLLAEGHYRLASPLLAPAFALLALVALLSGDFNRRGQTSRLVAASAVMTLVQSASVALHSLAGASAAVIPFLYLLPLSLIALGLWLLVRRKRRLPDAPKLSAAGSGG